MPPRLSHLKSRYGCQRCKIRRVKCDEKHPICNNCRRHQVDCRYEDQAKRVPTSTKSARAQRQASPLSTSSGSLLLESSQALHARFEEDRLAFHGSDDDRRRLELRLLHYFTSATTCTFPSFVDKPLRDVWCNGAIHLAFKFDFLLNAIFAISALHINSDIPPDPSFYVGTVDAAGFERIREACAALKPSDLGERRHRAHRFYLNLAYAQQREAAAHIAPTNANALCLASILLSYQSLVAGRYDRRHADYEPPVAWLRMTKAIQTIYRAGVADPAGPKHILDFWSEIARPNFKDRAAIFVRENADPFAELLDFERHPEPGLDDESRAAYEEALCYVGGVHRAVQELEPLPYVCRRVLTIGPMVSVRFIDLVEQRRPRALAILALHCSLAKAVDTHWIFRGVADREVSGIQSLMPEEWQWAMRWPLACLSMDLSGYG